MTSAFEGCFGCWDDCGEPRGCAISSATRLHQLRQTARHCFFAPFFELRDQSLIRFASRSILWGGRPASIASCRHSAGSTQSSLKRTQRSRFSSERSEDDGSVVLGNAPVSLLLLCTCSAGASGLLFACRVFAAERRFSMISSAFANSASIRLWRQPSWNIIASKSRLSAHCSCVSLAMRAIMRSSAGRPPCRQ